MTKFEKKAFLSNFCQSHFEAVNRLFLRLLLCGCTRHCHQRGYMDSLQQTRLILYPDLNVSVCHFNICVSDMFLLYLLPSSSPAFPHMYSGITQDTSQSLL